MTNEQFEELKAQNAELRADMNARFEGVNAQFEGVNARDAELRDDMGAQFEEMRNQLERTNTHIGLAYETQDQRFERLESRMDALQIGHEAARDDMRGVADGVRGNYELLKGIEAQVEALDTRSDSLLIEFRSGHMDHEARLRILES